MRSGHLEASLEALPLLSLLSELLTTWARSYWGRLPKLARLLCLLGGKLLGLLGKLLRGKLLRLLSKLLGLLGKLLGCKLLWLLEGRLLCWLKMSRKRVDFSVLVFIPGKSVKGNVL